MINFTYKKKFDKHSITNNESGNITVILYKKIDCNNFTLLNTFTITPLETLEFDKYIIDDNIYKVEVEYNGMNNTFNIKHYPSYIDYIVNNIYLYICNKSCKCDDCDGSDKLCNILMLKTNIDIFKNIISPVANSFFNNIYKYSNCLLDNKSVCNVQNNVYFGKEECDTKSIRQLIMLDYLGLYFYELAWTTNEEEKRFVNEKFKIDDIFCCIEKLDININEIQNLINNNMGQFKINVDAYVNQPPSSVGDYETTISNRETLTLTKAMFTTDTTPAYADPEGDPADAIRIDSLPGDGTLEFNGHAVSVGDIILISDIDNGLLSYKAPNQDAADVDTFDFSVRDTGSGQFSS